MLRTRFSAAIVAAACLMTPVVAFAHDCSNYAEGADRTRCQHRGPGWIKTAKCEAYDSHADRGWCKEDVAAVSSDETEALYKATLASARKAEFSMEPTLKQGFIRDLIQSQVIWRRFRNVECSAETGAYGGGTMALDVGPSCRQTLADQRLRQLEMIKQTLEQ